MAITMLNVELKFESNELRENSPLEKRVRIVIDDCNLSHEKLFIGAVFKELVYNVKSLEDILVKTERKIGIVEFENVLITNIFKGQTYKELLVALMKTYEIKRISIFNMSYRHKFLYFSRNKKYINGSVNLVEEKVKVVKEPPKIIY